MLKRICAWCKVTMGYKERGDGETHGICDTCLTKLRDDDAIRRATLADAESASGEELAAASEILDKRTGDE